MWKILNFWNILSKSILKAFVSQASEGENFLMFHYGKYVNDSMKLPLLIEYRVDQQREVSDQEFPPSLYKIPHCDFVAWSKSEDVLIITCKRALSHTEYSEYS